MTSAPTWRRRALLVLAAGVPLVFLRQANDPINVPKLAFLIVGVSLVGALRIAEGWQGRGFSGLRLLEVPAVAVVAALLIALLFSPYRGWALFGHYPRFTGFLPYLVVVLFAVLVADAFRGDAAALAHAVVVAGGGVGFYAVVQRVGLDPFTWVLKDQAAEVISSTLGNPNFVGGFLAIVMPIALVLLLTEREKRAWLGAASFLTIAGWIVALSESGWAAGVAGVAVVSGYAISRRWSAARVGGLVVAGVIAFGLIGAVSAAALNDSSDALPATVERRGDWWQASLSMAAANPIVGRGPGAFALEHSRYRTIEDAALIGFDITDDPHSVPLAFLNSAGVVGLAGLLVALGWLLRRGWTVGPGNLIAVGFVGGVIAYIVQSLVSIDTFALRTALWTCAAGLVAATSAADDPVRSRRAGKKVRNQPLNAPIGIAVAALVGLLGAWWGIRIVRADVSFANAAKALAEGDVQAMQSSYDTARSLREDVFYRRSEGNANGRLAVAAVLGDQPEVGRELLDRARAAFDHLPEFPHANSIADYARALTNYGSIDLDSGAVNILTGDFDPEARAEGFALYQEAVELDPNNPSLLSDAADLGLALEEFQTIVEMLEPKAAELNRPSIWGRLALAHAGIGNDDEARSAAENALSLEPGNETALTALDLVDREN